MKKFNVGLFVGMVLGMSTFMAGKKSKQLIKKAKSVLDI